MYLLFLRFFNRWNNKNLKTSPQAWPSVPCPSTTSYVCGLMEPRWPPLRTGVPSQVPPSRLPRSPPLWPFYMQHLACHCRRTFGSVSFQLGRVEWVMEDHRRGTGEAGGRTHSRRTPWIATVGRVPVKGKALCWVLSTCSSTFLYLLVPGTCCSWNKPSAAGPSGKRFRPCCQKTYRHTMWNCRVG